MEKDEGRWGCRRGLFLGIPKLWDYHRHLSFYISHVTLRHSSEDGGWPPDLTLTFRPYQGQILRSGDNCHAIYATKQNVTTTNTATTTLKPTPTDKDNNTQNAWGSHSHIHPCVTSVRSGTEVQTCSPGGILYDQPFLPRLGQTLLHTPITHPIQPLKTLVTGQRNNFLLSPFTSCDHCEAKTLSCLFTATHLGLSKCLTYQRNSVCIKLMKKGTNEWMSAPIFHSVCRSTAVRISGALTCLGVKVNGVTISGPWWSGLRTYLKWPDAS